MFKPGQSGNPSGRPKSDATIKELAKSHTQEAIETLVEIASNKKASANARVSAATALLDRGWGRPHQYVESVSIGLSYTDFLEESAKQAEEESLQSILTIATTSNETLLEGV